MAIVASRRANTVISFMGTFMRRRHCVHRFVFFTLVKLKSALTSLNRFQISCLNDVCGMFPFIATDIPDQFYRLFTSLLLHAGILHVAITVAFQHIFLADLERLIGPLRTAIIYIGSGIAGNLTSSLLVPYKTEVCLFHSKFWIESLNLLLFQVGPLSSLAGVTSSLCVMLTFYYWKKLKKPHIALVKLLIITIALFGLGTLPWQQNFASLIAGSIFGMILTLTIVPFMSISKFNRKSKVQIVTSNH